jgi:hypothetical protein
MGYEQFCVEVLVVEDLIKKKQITYMSRLYKKFIQIVQRVKGADASSFWKFRLKQRLMKSYPQLVFVTPNHRNVSEIVFTENLRAKDIVKDGEYADTSCHAFRKLNGGRSRFNVLRNIRCMLFIL